MCINKSKAYLQNDNDDLKSINVNTKRHPLSFPTYLHRAVLQLATLLFWPSFLSRETHSPSAKLTVHHNAIKREQEELM